MRGYRVTIRTAGQALTVDTLAANGSAAICQALTMAGTRIQGKHARIIARPSSTPMKGMA